MLSHHGVELFEKISRIRRYSLVGGSKSLEGGFEVPKAHARPSRSQLLLQHHACQACCHAPRHENDGLNLQNYMQAPQLNDFFHIVVALVTVSLQHYRAVTETASKVLGEYKNKSTGL